MASAGTGGTGGREAPAVREALVEQVAAEAREAQRIWVLELGRSYACFAHNSTNRTFADTCSGTCGLVFSGQMAAQRYRTMAAGHHSRRCNLPELDDGEFPRPRLGRKPLRNDGSC